MTSADQRHRPISWWYTAGTKIESFVVSRVITVEGGSISGMRRWAEHGFSSCHYAAASMEAWCMQRLT
jgi:hypothetical protein